MAAGEGFEPSQTESESVVLPLHNPARHMRYYSNLHFLCQAFSFAPATRACRAILMITGQKQIFERSDTPLAHTRCGNLFVPELIILCDPNVEKDSRT